MTTPDLAGLCEQLRAKARASFEANKSFGRRGKEWAIETELEWQAAAAIERLVADNERMREALKPFATFAEIVSTKNGEPYTPADEDIFPAGPVRWKHLRRARTALEGASDDR